MLMIPSTDGIYGRRRTYAGEAIDVLECDVEPLKEKGWTLADGEVFEAEEPAEDIDEDDTEEMEY